MFPYRKTYMPAFEVMYEALVSDLVDVPATQMSGYLGMIERSYPDNYEQVSSLTDHFVEQVRIDAREDGHMSPRDAWIALVKKSPQRKLNAMTSYELREKVYADARGCNLFNACLGVYLIRTLGARKILDVAAGWGDRLIATFASHQATIYHGWDTNARLQPVYGDIGRAIKELPCSDGRDVEFHVECAPFEKTIVENYTNDYDLAFFCPPFFTKELYEGGESSTNKYRSRKVWINEFYVVSIQKAMAMLAPGGYFVAYISDFWMLKHAHTVADKYGEYIGKYGFVQATAGGGTIRNTYVWKKY